MLNYIHQLLILLLNENCYDEYFNKFNFLHIACFKSTLSKGLGYGIILGAVSVKVPQILKIYNARSGKGINVLGVILDLFAISSSLAYNIVNGFPFSSWGEGLFLALQTAVIALLVLHYNRQTTIATIFLLIYCGLFYAAIFLCPLNILWSIQIANVPIIVFGKGLQILSNIRAKTTGQLSAVTSWLLFAGSLTRIFTSIEETGDLTLIVTYLIAATLNGVIVVQLYYYAAPKGLKTE